MRNDCYISPELRERMRKNPTPSMLDLYDVEQIRYLCDNICQRQKKLDAADLGLKSPCECCILKTGDCEPCVRVMISNQYFKLIIFAHAEMTGTPDAKVTCTKRGAANQ